MKVTVLLGISGGISLGSSETYYCHPTGDDAGPATFAAPLQSVQACVDKLSDPGDSCLLKAGVYGGSAGTAAATVAVSGKHGTAAEPIVIAAAGDGPVVLDGTAPIATPWAPWTGAPAGADIYVTAPPFPVWQLFNGSSADAGEMLVPARWPNARWSDKSMFEGPEHWGHAATGQGEHNTSTGIGYLTDAGACNASTPCCASCNNNSLAASGIDATGAVAILNLWADGTGAQVIERHRPGDGVLHYNATWCAAEVAQRGKCGDGYRDGRGRYYLEGPVALLDQPGEWSYDAHAGKLYLWAPGGGAPDPRIAAKVQSYALNFTNSSFVTIANLTLFGTALTAYDDADDPPGSGRHTRPLVKDLRFESLDFEYPSAARRMLGDLSPIDCVSVWTDARTDAEQETTAPTAAPPASERQEGCDAELEELCRENPRTMSKGDCMACAARVAPSFKQCTASRAHGICSKIRTECADALAAAACSASGGNACLACATAHAAALEGPAANCTRDGADFYSYCNVTSPTPPPAPTPVPGPPGLNGPAFTNHRFVDCHFRYADGMALQAQGSGWSFENCGWSWNSWTGLGSSTPNAWENGGTFVFSGLPAAAPAGQRAKLFERLSFANNGGSKCLRPPGKGAFSISLVDFGSQLQLADDGCMVETGGPTSAHMLQNWCHDSGKSALRFDGAFATGTANGAMVGNVAWNVGSFMVKGDNHTIASNTAFDGADIGASQAAATRPHPAQRQGDALTNTSFASAKVESRTDPKADALTTFDGNLFDGVGTWKPGPGGNRSCDPSGANSCHGKWAPSNVVGSWEEQGRGAVYDVKAQLRDPWHRDFRPCPGSLAAARGAGAYKEWALADANHWIPGAKDRRGASQPSPRDGGATVATDADLIFLGAFRAVGHTVLVAEGAGARFVPLATLAGEDNVAHPGTLKAGATYSWRVDARMADGSTRTGPTWTFTAGSHVACPPVKTN